LGNLLSTIFDHIFYLHTKEANVNIEWELVAQVAVPTATLFLGKYLDLRFFRSKLITYLVHASAFTLPAGIVHTHSIVVRNAGRETAKDVRIGHKVLPPHFQIFPAVPHTPTQSTTGISEIVISKMVPNEQITISYLYFPPLYVNQIHAYIKSDEGFARELNVLPTPQLPRWQVMILRFLLFVGTVSLLYVLVELVRRFT
jgi:hypothetical protein